MHPGCWQLLAPTHSEQTAGWRFQMGVPACSSCNSARLVKNNNRPNTRLRSILTLATAAQFPASHVLVNIPEPTLLVSPGSRSSSPCLAPLSFTSQSSTPEAPRSHRHSRPALTESTLAQRRILPRTRHSMMPGNCCCPATQAGLRPSSSRENG